MSGNVVHDKCNTSNKKGPYLDPFPFSPEEYAKNLLQHISINYPEYCTDLGNQNESGNIIKINIKNDGEDISENFDIDEDVEPSDLDPLFSEFDENLLRYMEMNETKKEETVIKKKNDAIQTSEEKILVQSVSKLKLTDTVIREEKFYEDGKSPTEKAGLGKFKNWFEEEDSKWLKGNIEEFYQTQIKLDKKFIMFDNHIEDSIPNEILPIVEDSFIEKINLNRKDSSYVKRQKSFNKIFGIFKKHKNKNDKEVLKEILYEEPEKTTRKNPSRSVSYGELLKRPSLVSKNTDFIVNNKKNQKKSLFGRLKNQYNLKKSESLNKNLYESKKKSKMTLIYDSKKNSSFEVGLDEPKKPVTLAQVKEFMPKYHKKIIFSFRTIEKNGESIYKELKNDWDLVPLYKGKIVCNILPDDKNL